MTLWLFHLNLRYEPIPWCHRTFMLLLELALCEWYNFPIHGCPSKILYFIWCPCRHFSFRVWESLFSPTMSLSKSFILLLNFMLAISFGTPLYISSCNCIFMSFYFLLELYAGSLTLIYYPYSPILSHVYPSRAFLYIFCSLIVPFPGRRPSPRCRYPTHISLHWA